MQLGSYTLPSDASLRILGGRRGTRNRRSVAPAGPGDRGLMIIRSRAFQNEISESASDTELRLAPPFVAFLNERRYIDNSIAMQLLALLVST